MRRPNDGVRYGDGWAVGRAGRATRRGEKRVLARGAQASRDWRLGGQRDRPGTAAGNPTGRRGGAKFVYQELISALSDLYKMVGISHNPRLCRRSVR